VQQARTRAGPRQTGEKAETCSSYKPTQKFAPGPTLAKCQLLGSCKRLGPHPLPSAAPDSSFHQLPNFPESVLDHMREMLGDLLPWARNLFDRGCRWSVQLPSSAHISPSAELGCFVLKARQSPLATYSWVCRNPDLSLRDLDASLLLTAPHICPDASATPSLDLHSRYLIHAEMGTMSVTLCSSQLLSKLQKRE
jgi:hypothetical protein